MCDVLDKGEKGGWGFDLGSEWAIYRWLERDTPAGPALEGGSDTAGGSLANRHLPGVLWLPHFIRIR